MKERHELFKVRDGNMARNVSWEKFEASFVNVGFITSINVNLYFIA